MVIITCDYYYCLLPASSQEDQCYWRQQRRLLVRYICDWLRVEEPMRTPTLIERVFLEFTDAKAKHLILEVCVCHGHQAIVGLTLRTIMLK